MFAVTGYKIIECIYKGNKDIVYKAIRSVDDTPVILKMPLSQHPNLSNIVMLKHEYEIQSKIQSKTVVKIYGIEQINNIPVIIMEDFGGTSLQNVINIKKLTINEFLKLANNITEALNNIHKFNIVHNDINPMNIIVNMETATVKITDFGLAAMFSKKSQCVENNNSLGGTPNYISPEQTGRLNKPVDFRSDLYSLGVTFYQMLTSLLPFQATDGLGLIHSHLAIKPEPLYEVCEGIPRVLSDIVMKLMEKMAENRYQSALGLKCDLQKCSDSLQSKKIIEYFSLAKDDFSDRFDISKELYGRDKEIEDLKATFDRISKGEKEIMIIKGHSGIGKSALINEINKPIFIRQGHFITGKFD